MDDNRQKRIALALGASIAKMRAQKNLTQEQVAEKLGVGNEAISRIERGAVMPPLIRLFEFAELFGCRVDELLISASDRATDQAAFLSQAIEHLNPSDRELVLNLVEQLSARLTQPTKIKK
ncbi:helix-turn-helix transcriptional regulator [Acidovorax sp.]|uniref:helix-turn-helix domain-containing protein n=1 Tax=Acidovorax sp. TaxID=1872122 RepID=UPI00258D780F|nr:helix-turn-helix transcriptional regulator [Acidovorax sp.]